MDTERYKSVTSQFEALIKKKKNCKFKRSVTNTTNTNYKIVIIKWTKFRCSFNDKGLIRPVSTADCNHLQVTGENRKIKDDEDGDSGDYLLIGLRAVIIIMELKKGNYIQTLLRNCSIGFGQL